VATYFADTSFWIAISSRRDQYHSQAAAWHHSVVRTVSRIVTTEAVLWEWLNALSDASTRTIAAEGYRRVHSDPRIEVVPFQPELNDAAIALYQGRADKNWSLTDVSLSGSCSGTQSRRRSLRITDRHFEQAGLKASRLDHPGA
jgi:predicted nucleic acid-binding protein